jgi:hypothetical protein
VSVTYCIDPRCTASQRCWREANERYGNAPGENYGPRCIPAPPSVGQTYEQGIAEGERRACAAVVAWLRERAARRGFTVNCPDELAWCADTIERGEHRRSGGEP